MVANVGSPLFGNVSNFRHQHRTCLHPDSPLKPGTVTYRESIYFLGQGNPA